jgi:hypothetical protein
MLHNNFKPKSEGDLTQLHAEITKSRPSKTAKQVRDHILEMEEAVRVYIKYAKNAPEDMTLKSSVFQMLDEDTRKFTHNYAAAYKDYESYKRAILKYVASCTQRVTTTTKSVSFAGGGGEGAGGAGGGAGAGAGDDTTGDEGDGAQSKELDAFGRGGKTGGGK